jgi:hypothetical protein
MRAVLRMVAADKAMAMAVLARGLLEAEAADKALTVSQAQAVAQVVAQVAQVVVMVQ